MNMASYSIIPPGAGGVRDYASILSGPLHAPLLELAEATETSGLSGDLLLVHFSGYGFQARGVPAWLVRRLRQMRPRFNQVGVVFHELFASGPPWSSAFWLSGAQKRIARELVALADFWVTNREESARWLSRYAGPVPHKVLPVFSNVGELDTVDGRRQDTLVVFGSAEVRSKVYAWANGQVFDYAKRSQLQIHDIGPTIGDVSLQARLSEEGVAVRGKLSADEVSAALAAARLGAVAYPVEFVAKSGVFAAYCAHGVCPILLSSSYATHDGLVANEHFLAGFNALAGDSRARVVGSNARAWYEPHRVSAAQAAFQALARGSVGGKYPVPGRVHAGSEQGAGSGVTV
ncbi:hypothetical protein QTI24_11990 [Variovorax sp. J22P240]|uniref:hypothetical protein n=1 Tax=Variovorax sp. J22P240 TaxID=3053514 RepID=UPI002577EC8C|nr:hypothetical protein [Variovorax sp. J22P240]MDL9999329.1 hypothetical protein [Variovorax sp. J22P240]